MAVWNSDVSDVPIAATAAEGAVRQDRRSRHGYIGLPVISVIGVLVYLNSLHGAFVFDEYDWIINNPRIRHLWPPWAALFGGDSASRPLVSYSFAINYWISGLDPWSYHALNVLIHIIAALALYGIVRRTLLTDKLIERFGGSATALGLSVALIWMVHPLQTQSVTYVVQRCESMMGMFYLLCIYSSIRSYDSQRKMLWYGAAVAACIGGALSKQVVVTAPLMVLLYDFVFRTEPCRETLRRRWPLYAGLAATWPVLAITVVASPANLTAGFAVKTVSSWDYFKTELGVIVYYLRLSIWPRGLCLDYAGWPSARSFREVGPYFAIVAGLVIATILALIKRRPPAFLGLWFFGILSVTSTVMPYGDFVFEHRMYLPLAAPVAFVVLGCHYLAAKLRARFSQAFNGHPLRLSSLGLIAVTIAICVLGFLTVRRNIDYSSPAAMWSDVVRKRPDNPRGHSNLGNSLMDLGQLEKATQEFTAAVNLDPEFEPAQNHLGMALYAEGRLNEAAGRLMEALALDPRDAGAHCNLGRVLADMGRNGEAVKEFVIASTIKPDFASTYFYLGLTYVNQNDFRNAIGSFQRAVMIDPGFEVAQTNLGMAYYSVGDLARAKRELLRATSLNPQDALAHCDLGRVFTDLGQTADAAAEFAQATRIKPDYAEAYLRYGYLLEKEGQIEDAKEQYRLAVQLRPDWASKARTELSGLK